MIISIITRKKKLKHNGEEVDSLEIVSTIEQVDETITKETRSTILEGLNKLLTRLEPKD